MKAKCFFARPSETKTGIKEQLVLHKISRNFMYCRTIYHLSNKSKNDNKTINPEYFLDFGKSHHGVRYCSLLFLATRSRKWSVLSDKCQSPLC